MAYTKAYKSKALAELREARKTYGQDFREHMDHWIDSLAENAESSKHLGTRGPEELLEQLTQDLRPEQQEHQWDQFRAAPFLQKLRSLIFWARKGRPPWQIQVAMTEAPFLNVGTRQVVAIYHLDDLKCEIEFVKFEGDFF